jgi:hypothetical protein
MPKVVPSQIVVLIDEVFPAAKTTPKFLVYSGHTAVLSAIVSLTNQIPDELITISGADYADLVHASDPLSTYVVQDTVTGPPARPPGGLSDWCCPRNPKPEPAWVR